MRIDFSKVTVHTTFEGEPDVIDYRKSLGNNIRKMTGDIGLDEFARKIYFSDGEIDVPHEFVPRILEVVQEKYIVATQEAFNKLLTINKEDKK